MIFSGLTSYSVNGCFQELTKFSRRYLHEYLISCNFQAQLKDEDEDDNMSFEKRNKSLRFCFV